MKLTNKSNIGWVVNNGSGWNHHQTADTLNNLLAESPETLPAVPVGYGVLVAPISDKPFGLRCALVKVMSRKMELIDGVEYDDGPADDAGEQDQWSYNQFGMEVERIYSCKEEQQSSDASEYFIRQISEQIAKL